jgi:hypothetical protein
MTAVNGSKMDVHEMKRERGESKKGYILSDDLTSLSVSRERLCGLVVSVPGYRSRGPGFDSGRYHIF